MPETAIDEHNETEYSPDSPPILLDIIVNLLARMFLSLGAGDIRLARIAALETVDAYGARNNADLIAAAQITGFGLAALCSLNLSTGDNIPIPMILRLRSNASACSRSAEQNRRALGRHHDETPQPRWVVQSAEPEIPPPHIAAGSDPDPDGFATPAAERHPAAQSQGGVDPTSGPVSGTSRAPVAPTARQKRDREIWARAMAQESNEIAASIPNLPPAQREVATMRAAMLSSAAHDLMHLSPEGSSLPGFLAGLTPPDTGRSQPPP